MFIDIYIIHLLCTFVNRFVRKKGVIFIIYKLFIAEVKKQLSIRNWKYEDLAKATGFKVGTIKAFMCGYRHSDNVAKCISETLGIDI